MRRRDDEVARLFQNIAEKGHYAGRTRPTGTRQGIYVVAPDGRFIASINTVRAEDMKAMLETALTRWESMRNDGRSMPRSLARALDSPTWWDRQYPENGLVLRVNARDLPRSRRFADWREEAWNQDYAWFREAEAGSLVPDNRVVGATTRLDPTLVRRIALLHLVDNVRGQTPPFDPIAFESGQIESRITAVDESRLTLVLRGSTRVVQTGQWPINGSRDTSRNEQERGIETTMLGRATFDTESDRFVSFELVGLGTRWGATQYNGRADDADAAPIGFLFTLAETEERVPPGLFWRYGW